MRKVWLLEGGDVRQLGDSIWAGHTWYAVCQAGIKVASRGEVVIREITDDTPDIATKQKLAAIEARLRYVENELQANKDLRQDDIAVEKQYRLPILPDDWNKPCEFSDNKKTWCKGVLFGYVADTESRSFPWTDQDDNVWQYARIEVTE